MELLIDLPVIFHRPYLLHHLRAHQGGQVLNLASATASTSSTAGGLLVGFQFLSRDLNRRFAVQFHAQGFLEHVDTGNLARPVGCDNDIADLGERLLTSA